MKASECGCGRRRCELVDDVEIDGCGGYVYAESGEGDGCQAF